jgi:two-component system, NarL family, sensor histidine kinase BarA
MFKRLRQLRISLAAKCQLLLGSAVLLVIAAALVVPWQRMEQLMDQMNTRTARTIADWAESEHVVKMRLAGLPASRPASRPSTFPSTLPYGREMGSARGMVRMFLVNSPATLLKFESRALDRFKADPAADDVARIQTSAEGPATFRFARPLAARNQCMPCHRGDIPAEQAKAVEAGIAKDPPPLLGIVTVEMPYQEDANQTFLNRVFMFLAGVLASVVALAVFYFITTGVILRPVRVLQEAADKVSQGDLNIRSHIGTGDEFQHLSETFNRMLENLQAGEAQLRAINTSLDMKLGELAESNLALYESNRLKSEFLANVSHELRTPLNSILGFAELLRDGPAAADPKALRYIQNIVGSGKNLLDLINDLLDLAKIEAGRMEVRAEKLSLNDLFEGLLSILKPLSEKKELVIEEEVAPDVPILQTDPAKLQQILYNLLSNAIKFSPNGGRIELGAQRTDETHVRIQVRDQGPGIPLEMQQTLFEKFRQLDASHTRQHGGTGLGLSISRELTQLLGGRIDLTSVPDQGATFWITLPLSISAEAKPILLAVQNG